MTAPRIIKLGGSLMRSPHLGDWLQALGGQGAERVIIVPGGGEFADRVRQAQQQSGFDDRSAHRLALLAMLQYGHLLLTLNPVLQPAFELQDIHAAFGARRIPVWLPLVLLNDETEVVASWDWSSDSIALWLANQLQADLYLVKSIGPDKIEYKAEELQQAAVVDAAFAGLLRTGSSRAYWLGPAQQGAAQPDYSELKTVIT